MKFCKRCGQKLQDNVNFCTGCGFKQLKAMQKPLTPAVDTQVQLNYPRTDSQAFITIKNQDKKSALPSIIWSLILAIIFNPIGTPISVAAAILSVIANADDNIDTCNRKLRIAFVLCIAATVIDVLSFIFLLISAFPFLHAPHGIGL